MKELDPAPYQPTPEIRRGTSFSYGEVELPRNGGSGTRRTWRLIAALVALVCGIVFLQIGGILFLFLALYLFSSSMVSRPVVRRTLLHLQVSAVAVYLALLLGELVIGGWPKIPSKNPMASLRGLFVEDGKAEFRNARNFEGVFDDGLVRAQFRTNSLGDRDDEPGFEGDGRCRLLLLGDSFAFGWGLTRDQTIERQLELMGAGRVDAYNLGVIAYNAEKVLARFEAADWWRGTAVLYLFFNNDLVDVELDSLVIRDGYLVNRANQGQVAYYAMEVPVALAVLHSVFGLRNLRERLEVLRDRERALAVWPHLYSSATIANAVAKTKEMESLAGSRGASFIAVILPTRGETEWRQYSKSTAAYLDGLENEGIEFLELRDQLDPGDYFSTDGHFNWRGAQEAAAAILDKLQVKDLVPTGTRRRTAPLVSGGHRPLNP
jgi:hypothetical protein